MVSDMNVGTRVEIVWMPDDKKEFIGRKGVLSSCKPGSIHIGVRLDNDFRDIALMAFQIKEVKE